MLNVKCLAVLLLLSSVAFSLEISKSEQSLLSDVKVANYSYKIIDSKGANLLVDSVVNKIDSVKNIMLDCDILTCDYKINVTAKQALSFGVDSISGGFIGAGVKVEKIFFKDIHSVLKTRPVFKLINVEICEESNSSNLIKKEKSCIIVKQQEQNGTETYYENEEFENTNLTVPFVKDTSRVYVIRFVKESPSVNVDIFHVIYGQERKDGAWWNASWAEKKSINFTGSFSNGHRQPIVINSSNMNYSKTNDDGSDIRFLDENNAVLPFCIMDWNESSQSYLMVKINNASVNNIYVYYNNSGATTSTANCSDTYTNYAKFGGATLPTGWTVSHGTSTNYTDSWAASNYDWAFFMKSITYNTSIIYDSAYEWNTTRTDGRNALMGPQKNGTTDHYLFSGSGSIGVGGSNRTGRNMAFIQNVSVGLNNTIDWNQNKKSIVTLYTNNLTGNGSFNFGINGVTPTLKYNAGGDPYYFKMGISGTSGFIRVYWYGERDFIYPELVPVFGAAESQVTDSCTYSGSGDWLIQISDNCTINTDTSLPANVIKVNGTGGTLTINASVTAHGISLTPSAFNGGFVVRILQRAGVMFGAVK